MEFSAVQKWMVIFHEFDDYQKFFPDSYINLFFIVSLESTVQIFPYDAFYLSISLGYTKISALVRHSFSATNPRWQSSRWCKGLAIYSEVLDKTSVIILEAPLGLGHTRTALTFSEFVVIPSDDTMRLRK